MPAYIAPTLQTYFRGGETGWPEEAGLPAFFQTFALAVAETAGAPFPPGVWPAGTIDTAIRAARAYLQHRRVRPGRLETALKPFFEQAARGLTAAEYAEARAAFALVCREAVPGAQDLHLLLARHGVRDHRAFASKVLGREVSHFSELAPEERNKIREALWERTLS